MLVNGMLWPLLRRTAAVSPSLSVWVPLEASGTASLTQISRSACMLGDTPLHFVLSCQMHGVRLEVARSPSV